MLFNPTLSQMSFYTGDSEIDTYLWNQGVMQVFPCKYSYEELNNAFNLLVKNNDSLRIQMVHTNNGPKMKLKDYTHRTYPHWICPSVEDLKKKAQQFLNQPIDFNGDLVRCAIFETPEVSGIMISGHHIVVDGYSVIVMAEHINNYLKEADYVPSDYQKYNEYIESENKYRTTRRYQLAKDFWIKEFQSNPVCSLYYNKKAVIDYTSSEANINISPVLFNKINDFCIKHKISIQSFFNTIYSSYFYKTTKHNRFTLGVPVLNRTTEAELNTIGLYMHIVPLVIEITDNSFCDNALKIENSQLNLFRYQKFTQTEILKTLEENNITAGRLFDVTTDFQQFNHDSSYELEVPYCNYLSVPLEVHMQSFQGKKHNLKIRYRTSMFTEKEIQTMMNSIIAIAEDALDHPDKKISELNVVPDYEKALLDSFNDTKVEYPKDKCIHELFEEQVAQTPDKTAIVAADKTLSYRELNEEANAIAHSLIDIGIGKGDIVGLMLPRKSYLLSALLGILKTGAAYLPVDMEQPEERIKHILSDSNAKFCISEENLNNLLESSCTKNIINTASSDDFCYCIYTSGSTGLPKGTLLYHRNLVWYMSVLKNIYGTDNINMPFFTSPCVDLTVPSLYLPLLTGGTIYIYNGELKDDLLDIFNNDNLNILKFTPTHIGLVNKLIPSKPRPNIRCIIVGGESFSRASCIEFLNKFGHHIEIHNEYGPTETTVSCTDYIFDPNKNTDGVNLPIGSVVNNAQIYITDKHMQPVPLGVTGEICIAGDGVGAGYVNNPDLTSEKFICNPFGKGKLYKTGDLAYWCEDGNIMFAGRKDFQVKIRGFRVELEEIENAISKIDGIILSAVIVKEDKQSRHIICAFYTGEKKTEKQLREILRQTLPNYMIPHIFTHLEEIPMTTSGKINRNELPEFNLENIDIETEYVAPETAEERALFDVLCSVLNINNVNLAENFFNIGGDSIKAIYTVSELEEKGFELHVSDIMQQDTLLEAAKLIKPNSSKMIYDQNEVNGFIPFTPIMNAYIENNGKIANDFFHTCMISIDCDENTAIKALDAIISHHDILRGTISESGIEIHSSLESKAYSFQAITLNNCDEIKEYLNNITLTDSELINVVFFSTDKEHFLGISIHHFLIDLISWEILAEDLLAVIKQIKSNSKIKLPQKTASFKMWCEETQKYSESITNETKTYWKNVNDKLDNAQKFDLKEICSEKTESTHFVLDESTTKELINNANHKYGTKTNELLLTALGLAAAEIADGYVGIIVESHGRTELDKPIAIDRTVGWFTSCYPVIIYNNANIVDELISVKETLRKTPRSGIDYLLSSQKFHKNASIKFNFYESRTDSKYTSDQLKSFAFNGSVFKNKINVDCSLTKNVLTITISVPKNEHNIQLVEQLGVSFKEKLENFITICTDNPEIIKTCSDFSDDELTEAELDELKDLFDWTDNYEQQH